MQKLGSENLKISFSDEQAQLLDIAESFCRDKAPMAHVRDQLSTDSGFDRDLWREMAELGWMGITIPEEYGGSGLGIGEAVPVVEAMGRQLLATPYVTSILAAEILKTAGSDAQKSTWLPKIAAGAIVALATSEPHGDWRLTNLETVCQSDNGKLRLSGVKNFVCDVPEADMMLVTADFYGRSSIFLLDREQIDKVSCNRETVIDEARRSYHLRFDNLPLSASDELDERQISDGFRQLDLYGNLLNSAELCGAINGTLELIVEYLNTRRQFDRLIGSYQALKHPAADILTGLEAARSHLYFAAGIAEEEEAAEIAIRMASAQAEETLAYAADRAIQFHGGFGFTYDCDAQLYRRRSLWCAARYGDARYQRQRLAELLLD